MPCEPSGGADPKRAYLRLMAAVGVGDERVVDDIVALDLVDHNPIPGQASGREGFKQWLRAARTSFPDLQAMVEHVVVEGDLLAGRVVYRGTHRGILVGVPGTGRSVSFEAFHFVRFREGQAVEWWGTADLLGALTQSGARIVPQSEAP